MRDRINAGTHSGRRCAQLEEHLSSGKRELRRNTEKGKLAGVCAGLAANVEA